MALSTIILEQTKEMEQTIERCTQLLDYLVKHAEAKVQFHAPAMIMNIHLDASYLLEVKARSQAFHHFFLGWIPADNAPIQLNGAFHVSTTILLFIVDSTAKAEWSSSLFG